MPWMQKIRLRRAKVGDITAIVAKQLTTDQAQIQAEKDEADRKLVNDNYRKQNNTPFGKLSREFGNAVSQADLANNKRLRIEGAGDSSAGLMPAAASALTNAKLQATVGVFAKTAAAVDENGDDNDNDDLPDVQEQRQVNEAALNQSALSIAQGNARGTSRSATLSATSALNALRTASVAKMPSHKRFLAD